MTESQLSPYILSHLNGVIRDHGLANIKIESKKISKDDVNVQSELHAITIYGERSSVSAADKQPIQEKLELVCKTLPSSQHRRDVLGSRRLFVREAFIYNEILPVFVKFQQEKGLSAEDSFLSFPKCYLAVANAEQDDFIIIMSNELAKGFIMWPKKQNSRADHCRLVVVALAKLHAISLALKDQRPETFEKFTKLTDQIRQLIYQSFFLNAIKGSQDMISKYLEDEEQRKAITDIKENVCEYFDNCVGEHVNDRFSVIIHGDCWNNNILFTYDDDKNIANNLCLVDWQMTRYGSPVIDLLHYLYQTTDKQLRDAELNNLFQLYYSTISRNIEKLGSKPALLFSYDDFMEQMRKFGNYALVLGPLFGLFDCGDPRERNSIDDLTEGVTQDKPLTFFKSYNEKSLEEFKTKVGGVIGDIITSGFHRKRRTQES